MTDILHHDGKCNDSYARERAEAALEANRKAWEGIGNVLREVAAVREYVSVGLADLGSNASDFKEHVDRALLNIHNHIRSLAQSSGAEITGSYHYAPISRSDFPIKLRSALKEMLGGGILNLIWIGLGVAVTIWVYALFGKH